MAVVDHKFQNSPLDFKRGVGFNTQKNLNLNELGTNSPESSQASQIFPRQRSRVLPQTGQMDELRSRNTEDSLFTSQNETPKVSYTPGDHIKIREFPVKNQSMFVGNNESSPLLESPPGISNGKSQAVQGEMESPIQQQ